MERSNKGGEIEMLKIAKTRNVETKLVDEREHPVVLDDEEVNDMIKDLMSEYLIDEENKHQSKSIRSGNTIVEILDNNFEKFTEAMKHISPRKLQEVKKQIRDAVQKDPLLNGSLDDVGIDLDNFENYLGTVQVFTIEKVRVYNVYEKKERIIYNRNDIT
jgi:transcription antitermination factor NusG